MSTLSAIIGWIVFGIIVGALARFLMPGRQPMGMMMTIILGIVGSFLGGMVSWIFTGGPNQPYQPSGWILSIIGAIVVLWIGAYYTKEPRGV